MTVLVTVTPRRRSPDLELDDARCVAELVPELVSALGAGARATLALVDGTPLDAGMTLAAAGVLDGHRLVLTDPASQHQAVPEVLPCYVAVDTSDSVAGPALDAVNVELGRLVDALRDDPRVSGSCRLAVLTFDVEARVVLGLTPVAQLADAPRLSA